MGGGKKFDYPKYVWTPYGGWWPNARSWRRNSLFTFFGFVAITIPIVMVDLSLVEYHTIDGKPSQHWYAKIVRWYRNTETDKLPQD